MGDPTPGGNETLRRERDSYKHLLDVAGREEIEPFLQEALSLMVALTGARRGDIELSQDRDDDGPQRLWMAHAFYNDDLEAGRAAFSRELIAEAIGSGKTIVTESAAVSAGRLLQQRKPS